jgi:hypothetical protein
MNQQPKKPRFKAGDFVRILKIPSDLDDSAGIGTPEVFARALGGTFRIDGIDKHGYLEIVVAECSPTPATYKSDTIYIEPEFVEPVSGRQKIASRRNNRKGTR